MTCLTLEIVDELKSSPEEIVSSFTDPNIKDGMYIFSKSNALK